MNIWTKCKKKNILILLHFKSSVKKNPICMSFTASPKTHFPYQENKGNNTHL